MHDLNGERISPQKIQGPHMRRAPNLALTILESLCVDRHRRR